jgi:CBS domain-containing protein
MLDIEGCEMKKNEPISSIMTREVVTLSLKDTLYSAEKRMKVNHIRHMPVVDGDRLIGLISLSDLQRVSFIDAYSREGTEDTPVYNMLSIKDLMIKNPLTATPKTTILEVSKLLASKEFHSLPVVEDDKLVGIITTTDLLHYFIELC